MTYPRPRLADLPPVTLTGEQPLPEGTRPGAPIDLNAVGGDVRRARWTLTGMAVDFRFFTHAALLASGVPRDPVQVYWAENNLPPRETPQLIEFDAPVLRGPAAPLDRYVFACPAVHAAGLFRFLDRLSFRQADGSVWDSVHQRIPLVDWILAAQLTIAPPAPPVVDLEAFGLDGPAGTFGWRPPPDPWKEHPCLVWRAKAIPPPGPGGTTSSTSRAASRRRP